MKAEERARAKAKSEKRFLASLDGVKKLTKEIEEERRMRENERLTEQTQKEEEKKASQQIEKLEKELAAMKEVETFRARQGESAAILESTTGMASKRFSVLEEAPSATRETQLPYIIASTSVTPACSEQPHTPAASIKLQCNSCDRSGGMVYIA